MAPVLSPHALHNAPCAWTYVTLVASGLRTLDGRTPMPVSAKNSHLIYDALKACDIRMMSALPETWLVHLIRQAGDDPEVTLVRLAKEEEGVGISAGGRQGGGKGPVVWPKKRVLPSINRNGPLAHPPQ